MATYAPTSCKCVVSCTKCLRSEIWTPWKMYNFKRVDSGRQTWVQNSIWSGYRNFLDFIHHFMLRSSWSLASIMHTVQFIVHDRSIFRPPWKCTFFGGSNSYNCNCNLLALLDVIWTRWNMYNFKGVEKYIQRCLQVASKTQTQLSKLYPLHVALISKCCLDQAHCMDWFIVHDHSICRPPWKCTNLKGVKK